MVVLCTIEKVYFDALKPGLKKIKCVLIPTLEKYGDLHVCIPLKQNKTSQLSRPAVTVTEHKLFVMANYDLNK